MKFWEAESTVSWTKEPPETPIWTFGAAPKLAPSIARVGLSVSRPLGTTFEIVNCGGGAPAGAAETVVAGNSAREIKVRLASNKKLVSAVFLVFLIMDLPP